MLKSFSRGTGMYKEITAKTLLTRIKNPQGWFGVEYNMNIYRGCQHGCIYCDSRSECYRIDTFETVSVKVNAEALLREELGRKRNKFSIGTGAMSDPYTPAEGELKLTRKVLEIINDYNFPIHINTKSDMILRDIDVLKSINNTFASVAFTVTTCDEKLASKIEPYAPSPSARLNAMKQLSYHGIYTGVLLMPILPFIIDTIENVSLVVQNAYENGAKFIIPYFGMTLRDRQREYYYKKLDEHFPGLQTKYAHLFGNKYGCTTPNHKELYSHFVELCKKYDMIYEMDRVNVYSHKNEQVQISLFD